MQINNVASQIRDLVKNAQKALLITRESPTLDGVYSLVALKKYLEGENKQISLVAGELPEGADLYEKEKISQSLAPRNLVISFDYVEGSIEKVSYNVEGSKFNLVITPRGSSINPQQINYSYSGETFDLIFVVDVPEMSLLAKGASNLTHDYGNVPIINLDHTQVNSLYGQINFVDPSKSSTSEIVAELLSQLEKLSPESAALIYQGIKAATHNFSLGVKAQALETAATCLRVLENSSSSQLQKEPGPEQKTDPQSQDKVFQEETAPDSSWLSPKIFRGSHIPE